MRESQKIAVITFNTARENLLKKCSMTRLATPIERFSRCLSQLYIAPSYDKIFAHIVSKVNEIIDATQGSVHFSASQKGAEDLIKELKSYIDSQASLGDLTKAWLTIALGNLIKAIGNLFKVTWGEELIREGELLKADYHDLSNGMVEVKKSVNTFFQEVFYKDKAPLSLNQKPSVKN